jgi:hypothetical protein
MLDLLGLIRADFDKLSRRVLRVPRITNHELRITLSIIPHATLSDFINLGITLLSCTIVSISL